MENIGEELADIAGRIRAVVDLPSSIAIAENTVDPDFYNPISLPYTTHPGVLLDVLFNAIPASSHKTHRGRMILGGAAAPGGRPLGVVRMEAEPINVRMGNLAAGTIFRLQMVAMPHAIGKFVS